MCRVRGALAGAGHASGLAVVTPKSEQTPKAPAPKAAPDRVHVGATSVTVVDEHETVDDVITRLRAAKAHAGSATDTKTAAPASGAASPGARLPHGRASLRGERESVAAHVDADRPKEDRRERAANARARVERKPRR